jgi:hypothetical protein
VVVGPDTALQPDEPTGVPARQPSAANRAVASSSALELLLVLLGFAALTAAFFYPMSAAPGDWAYRPENGDGQFSIWNVAWVARALLENPRHVLDANIFYPHRGTLAYSELNLLAGLMAAPAYWVTRSAYAAHNTVVLASFVLSGTSMYYLCRYLVQDRRAAIIGGMCFAFCPHVFAHLLHIQLLMTAWLPLSLLAFYRVADRPSPGRGVILGLAMTGQALACHYYAVFAVLVVGFAVLAIAVLRRRWTDRRYWAAIAVAVLVAGVTAAPVVWPFLALRQAGFARPIEAAQQFAADWRAYFASAGLLHEWMLPYLGHWKEVLFPGFIGIGLGAVGITLGWQAGGRRRETVLLFTALGVLACWASFGPDAGLYNVLHATVPGFALMRASSRFGLIVMLALSVLAALGAQLLLARSRHATILAVALLVMTAADRYVPLQFEAPLRAEPAYDVLASLPYGAVLELPVYSRLLGFRRSRYMLDSTVHWKPLVDAYSDYIPDDFTARLDVLGDFPTRDALVDLSRDRVRYAVIHLDPYEPQPRADLFERLATFAPYLKERYRDTHAILLEIVAYPE